MSRFRFSKPACFQGDKCVVDGAICDWSSTQWGVCATEGRREDVAMEDCHVVRKVATSEHAGATFYGVFDGHGGQDCARTMSHLLPQAVLGTSAYATGDIRGALEEGYRRAEEEWLRSCCSSASGTTATLLHHADGVLSVSHVGDSRAVLGTTGDGTDGDVQAVQLTADHVARCPREQERIRRLGGCVTAPSGPDDSHRVNGLLEVTRSLGDAGLAGVVRADADVLVRPVQRGDRFVIVASDGLWDVVSNEQAVRLVRTMTDARAMAEKLAMHAWKCRSTDHIAVLVLRLNCDLDAPAPPATPPSDPAACAPPAPADAQSTPPPTAPQSHTDAGAALPAPALDAADPPRDPEPESPTPLGAEGLLADVACPTDSTETGLAAEAECESTTPAPPALDCLVDLVMSKAASSIGPSDDDHTCVAVDSETDAASLHAASRSTTLSAPGASAEVSAPAPPSTPPPAAVDPQPPLPSAERLAASDVADEAAKAAAPQRPAAPTVVAVSASPERPQSDSLAATGVEAIILSVEPDASRAADDKRRTTLRRVAALLTHGLTPWRGHRRTFPAALPEAGKQDAPKRIDAAARPAKSAPQYLAAAAHTSKSGFASARASFDACDASSADGVGAVSLRERRRVREAAVREPWAATGGKRFGCGLPWLGCLAPSSASSCSCETRSMMREL